jgi:hypothetical protein
MHQPLLACRCAWKAQSHGKTVGASFYRAVLFAFGMWIAFQCWRLSDHGSGALKCINQLVGVDALQVKELIVGPKILHREVHYLSALFPMEKLPSSAAKWLDPKTLSLESDLLWPQGAKSAERPA